MKNVDTEGNIAARIKSNQDLLRETLGDLRAESKPSVIVGNVKDGLVENAKSVLLGPDGKPKTGVLVGAGVVALLAVTAAARSIFGRKK